MENSVQPDAPVVEINAHPTQADLDTLAEAIKNDPGGESVHNPPTTLTDAQVEALARDTAQQGPVYHLNDGENDYDIDLSQYSESEVERVNQRRAEIEAEAVAEEQAKAATAPESTVDSDGYTLVGSVTYTEETNRIHVLDLKPKVEIEYDERAQRGVSAVLDRFGDRGIVTLRIIADHNAQATVSRKDENSVTHLKVQFRHQAA